MKTVRQAAKIALLLGLAVFFLAMASQSSPLYPTNTWEDANCIFTVGRVMRSGKILYRDIYEQKGPTLYLLHAAASLISDRDFFGVWLLEIVSLLGVLLGAERILRRRSSAFASVAGAALLGAGIVVCRAFAKGDSAEEICLPLLMGALCLADGEWHDEAKPMSARKLFLCGLLAGLVATIKYTILGLFIGLCAAEGIFALKEGGFLRALKSAAVFLCGMLLPIGLWVLYFAAHGALRDFYTAYLYNNIFLYEGAPSGIGALLRDSASMLLNNLFWSLPLGAGLLWTVLKKKASCRIFRLLMLSGAMRCVFILGRTWSYSPLVLAPFAVFGFEALSELFSGRYRMKRRYAAVLCLAACVAAMGMSARLTPNRVLRGARKKKLAQTVFAKYIQGDTSLLQYSHLDDGFYLSSGVLPDERYFVRLNVRSEEMLEALDAALENAVPEYVVTSWEPMPERFLPRYQLIAEHAGYDNDNRKNKAFYLYRRWSDEALEYRRAHGL